MPRTHGRIMAAIWNDSDFIAMDGGAQRMFMFLLSQPDLSHAGLIPMRINRWANKASDLNPIAARAELEYLALRGFIVMDDDTEEVLVRTFVRNDGVYKQPRVMDRMREDARQIESPLLRAAFRTEIDRLPLDELSDLAGGANADKPSTREQVERVVEGLREDFREGSLDPSVWVSDTPHVGAHAPHLPPSTVPQPPSTIPATPGGGEAGKQLALVPEAPTAQTLVAEWIDHCDEQPPKNVIGQIAKHTKALLDEGIKPDRVRRALAEWNRKGLHPSTLASVVHEISNRAPATRGQQATDDMFDRAMTRALAREEASR